MRTLTAVLLALLLTGCGITSPEALAVDVTLSADVVSPAHPIEVTVTATNRSDVAIDVDPSGCPQVFEVARSGLSKVVGPQSVSCVLALLAPSRLEPGEEITFHYEWAGFGVASDGAGLPPGHYRVRGWARQLSGDRVYSDYRSVRVAAD
jgi:hypothetical protein